MFCGQGVESSKSECSTTESLGGLSLSRSGSISGCGLLAWQGANPPHSMPRNSPPAGPGLNEPATITIKVKGCLEIWVEGAPSTTCIKPLVLILPNTCNWMLLVKYVTNTCWPTHDQSGQDTGTGQTTSTGKISV